MGVSSSTVLSRPIQDNTSQSTPPLSALQGQIDGLVSGFVAQAADGYTLASMVTGGLAYKLGKIGVMTLGNSLLNKSPFLTTLLRMSSVGIGFLNEVSAFELTRRGLEVGVGGANQDLLHWAGPQGIRHGLLHSAITLGALKGMGKIAQGQNLVLSHLLPSTGMVLANHSAYRMGLGSKPEGTLSEQMIHAEATNLQMISGMGLVHSTFPALVSLERGLDLSLQSKTKNLSAKRRDLWGPFLPKVALATETNSPSSLSDFQDQGWGERLSRKMMANSDSDEKGGGKNLPNFLSSPEFLEDMIRSEIQGTLPPDLAKTLPRNSPEYLELRKKIDVSEFAPMVFTHLMTLLEMYKLAQEGNASAANVMKNLPVTRLKEKARQNFWGSHKYFVLLIQSGNEGALKALTELALENKDAAQELSKLTAAKSAAPIAQKGAKSNAGNTEGEKSHSFFENYPKLLEDMIKLEIQGELHPGISLSREDPQFQEMRKNLDVSEFAEMAQTSFVTFRGVKKLAWEGNLSARDLLKHLPVKRFYELALKHPGIGISFLSDLIVAGNIKAFEALGNLPPIQSENDQTPKDVDPNRKIARNLYELDPIDLIDKLKNLDISPYSHAADTNTKFIMSLSYLMEAGNTQARELLENLHIRYDGSDPIVALQTLALADNERALAALTHLARGCYNAAYRLGELAVAGHERAREIFKTLDVDTLASPLKYGGFSALLSMFQKMGNQKALDSFARIAPSSFQQIRLLREIASYGNETAKHSLKSIDVAPIVKIILFGRYGEDLASEAFIILNEIADLGNSKAFSALQEMATIYNQLKIENLYQLAVGGDLHSLWHMAKPGQKDAEKLKLMVDLDITLIKKMILDPESERDAIDLLSTLMEVGNKKARTALAKEARFTNQMAFDYFMMSLNIIHQGEKSENITHQGDEKDIHGDWFRQINYLRYLAKVSSHEVSSFQLDLKPLLETISTSEDTRSVLFHLGKFSPFGRQYEEVYPILFEAAASHSPKEHWAVEVLLELSMHEALTLEGRQVVEQATLLIKDLDVAPLIRRAKDPEHLQESLEDLRYLAGGNKNALLALASMALDHVTPALKFLDRWINQRDEEALLALVEAAGLNVTEAKRMLTISTQGREEQNVKEIYQAFRDMLIGSRE